MDITKVSYIVSIIKGEKWVATKILLRVEEAPFISCEDQFFMGFYFLNVKVYFFSLLRMPLDTKIDSIDFNILNINILTSTSFVFSLIFGV